MPEKIPPSLKVYIRKPRREFKVDNKTLGVLLLVIGFLVIAGMLGYSTVLNRGEIDDKINWLMAGLIFGAILSLIGFTVLT
jgi:hypothetical protein